MENLEEYKFWLVFYRVFEGMKINVYHAIGLLSYPTEKEIQDFVEEVRTDEEFGLGDEVDNLTVVILNKEEGLEIARELLKD